MKHSIIIEESLKSPEVLKGYKILRTRFSPKQNWHLHVIEVSDVEKTISEIQQAMVENEPYYFHIYDEGETLKIIFKDTVFELDPNDKSTWQEARRCGGEKLGIPAEQLDFFPLRISQEDIWFNRE